MNLFLLSWSHRGGLGEGAGAEAVASVMGDLPYLDPAPVQTWRAPSGRAALAWIAHPPEQVGGVDYVRAEPRRLALFAGRPVCWNGDEPDGRGPLDPRAWWEHVDRLDGRCTAARYDDDAGELELFSDQLGAYPVFRARHGDGLVLSNSAEALRRHIGTTAVDPAAVASLVAGGWPLTGHPMWADVRRVPRGVVLRLAAGGTESVTELLPASALADWFAASEFDAEGAASALVASVRGLAGWSGRPDLVPVTGGRDSRLVLAAALRAGLDFRAVTVGGEDAPDVVVAQELCARAGVEHERLADPPGGASDHRSAAERAAIVTGGTATAEAPWGIPSGPASGPLVLWHSGQGGEIARGIYGRAPRSGIADHLHRAFAARRPGRPELLSPDGEQLVRGQFETWTTEMLDAGIAPADVPDAFYLLQRMGNWAGSGHGVVEWIRDTTSPLWSTHVIPHMLAMPTEQRARELFHLEVLRVLAPELVAVPFADGHGWPADESQWARRRRRAARIAARGAAEARRHAGWMRTRRRRSEVSAAPSLRAPAPAGADPLSTLMGELRAWVDTAPDHPVLAVVDRERVRRLLELPPATLDFVRHAQVMRLATVVMAVELAT